MVVPLRVMVKLPSSRVFTWAAAGAARPSASAPCAKKRCIVMCTLIPPGAAEVRDMWAAAPAWRNGDSDGSFVGCRSAEDSLADPFANALVQCRPLGRSRKCGSADRAGTPLWDAQPPAPVTSQLFARHHIILCELHSHEVGGEVQHDRRVDLIAVHRLGLTLEQVAQ